MKTGSRQYLQAMGIDVWERRSLLRPVVAPSPATGPVAVPEEKPAVTDAEREIPASPAQSRDVPRFRLGFYHYESVGLCLLLAEDAEIPRRLCDDIAGIMGGDIGKLRFQELNWPMLDTAGIDQSAQAAREVVTQKFRALPDRVIVFGAGLSEYFQPLSGLAVMSPARVGTQTMLLVSDLAGFMASAEEKRTLLRVLHDWRSGP